MTNYYTVIDSHFKNMANYKVLPGDTLATISKKLNVPTSALSGYKSQDPNLIMPGEELSVDNLPTPGTFTPPKPGNFQVPGAQPIPTTPTPTTQLGPAPAPITAPTVSAPTVSAPTTQPVVAGSQQITPAIEPANTVTVDPTTGLQTATAPEVAKVKRMFTLPSGQQISMDISPEADALLGGEATRNKPMESNTADKQVSTFFGQYGVDSTKLSDGFTANPVQTLTTLTDHVMKSMQIPDAISNITNITKQIEDLSNERDTEIQQIQDNPWKSAGSKAELIKKISDKYEQRIANRTNSLTLLQSAYQDARQQAQFAVTTAVGLYDKQRAFDQKSIEDAFNREESRAKTAFDNKKFEEDKRQFGLEYALKKADSVGSSGNGGISANAEDWIAQFNSGLMTIDEIYTKIGSAKESLPLRNAVAKLVAQQKGKRVYGTDDATILAINSQIKNIDDLLKPDWSTKPRLSSIVGKVQGGWGIFGTEGLNTGKQDVLAIASNLVSNQTLTTLAEAKSKGITFGALSEGELKLVSDAASRVASKILREDKDYPDKITGFSGSEKEFKNDLQTIKDGLVKAVAGKTGGTSQSTLPPSGMVNIQKPDGTTGFIPQENLQQAIKLGAKQL